MGQKLLQHKHADVGHPSAPADWARAAAWEDGRDCAAVLGWWKKRVVVGETFCLFRKTVC